MQQLAQGTLLRGGTYKIVSVLGQGSFGITYLAEHTSLERKVAIKEFFMKELNSRGEDGSITGMTDGSLSYNYAQKFRKEAQNLVQIDHPNIVHVSDSFDENGTYYYVMDYIEGQNLNDYIKEHPLSEQEAVDIILEVAKALQYMHEEKHMLHLDLKPGNIMRRASDGHIFLIDFGLSKHYSNDGEPETSTTIGLGTPGYAPIEQGNQAKSGEFRPTIDVYALGATLFKLLTGEIPPTASDIVSDDELVPDMLKEKGVSYALIKVVAKAMLPNVRKRVQTVEVFVQNLTNSLSTQISNYTTQQKQEDTLLIDYQKPLHSQLHNQNSCYEQNIEQRTDPQPPKNQYTHNNDKESPHFWWIVLGIIGVVIAFAIYKNANQPQPTVYHSSQQSIQKVESAPSPQKVSSIPNATQTKINWIGTYLINSQIYRTADVSVRLKLTPDGGNNYDGEISIACNDGDKGVYTGQVRAIADESFIKIYLINGGSFNGQYGNLFDGEYFDSLTPGSQILKITKKGNTYTTSSYGSMRTYVDPDMGISTRKE